MGTEWYGDENTKCMWLPKIKGLAETRKKGKTLRYIKNQDTEKRVAPSHEKLKTPVICRDGFTYEEESINEWLRTENTTSPMNRERLRILRGSKQNPSPDQYMLPNTTVIAYMKDRQAFKRSYTAV